MRKGTRSKNSGVVCEEAPDTVAQGLVCRIDTDRPVQTARKKVHETVKTRGAALLADNPGKTLGLWPLTGLRALARLPWDVF